METASAEAQGLWVEPGEDFVLTPYLEGICERALAYLQAGYPVHFSGPAGTGKSTLAFLLASKLGRPVMLIHGNDELRGADLIGSDAGYHRTKIIDNYVHSVMKTEEEVHKSWSDSRLTTACKTGSTLVYDEFTRSRAESNNVLLSVLEERILSAGLGTRRRNGLVEVHPDFRAIFTSNPQEYAGVHTMQDALLDRMITIHVDYADRQTETAITRARSGLNEEDAEKVVGLVRELRSRRPAKARPSLRASVMIARVLAQRGARASHDDPLFMAVCRDVLGARGGDDVDELLQTLAQPPAPPVSPPPPARNGRARSSEARAGGVR